MLARRPLKDLTESVSIVDAHAVARAVDDLLARRFGAGGYDRALLLAAYTDTERMFKGEHADYLACDMPYHDLRHSLDTSLVMARLIDGYQQTHAGSDEQLTPEYALFGVVLALMHDTGFLRRTGEAHLIGPTFMNSHEERGIALVERYLASTSLANYAPMAMLIDATKLMCDLNRLFEQRPGPVVALGQMLGTADLVAQLSDRYYVERCVYHLYPEFVLGGSDRIEAADGTVTMIYEDGFDLLRKTPAFYQRIVNKRLDDDFARAHRYLAAHFGGADPYAQAIAHNIARLTRVATTGRYDLLRREPTSTTRDLDPIYHQRLGAAGLR